MPVTDETIKIVFPVIAVIYWVFRRRSFAAPKPVTLYLTLFGVLSANFSIIYREVFQAYTMLLVLSSMVVIVRKRMMKRQAQVLLPFIATVLLSLGVNGMSKDAAISLINIVVIFFVVHVMLVWINSTRILSAFLDYYLEFAVAMAVLAPLDYFLLGQRAEGTFSNPNYYGYFIGTILPWSILAPSRKPRWMRFAMLSLAIISTGSRATVLVIPITLLMHLLRVFTDNRYRTMIGAVYAVAASMAILVLGLFVDKLSLLLSAGRDIADLASSDAERYRAIEVGLAMFRESPVYGVGWGHYLEKFSQFIDSSSSLFAATSVSASGMREQMVSHNDFIRVLAELGLLGAVAFVFAIVASVSCSIKQSGEYRYFFVSVISASLVYSLTHNNLNNLFFWLFLLLPLGIQRMVALAKQKI
jgi:O-antigen ligase